MMNEATLPSGWEITALENVCELVAGNPAPQGHQYFEKGKFNFVRVQDMGRMGDSTYLSETKDKINEQAITKLRLFPKGSVLFTKSGASTLNNQRAILGKDCYVVSHIAAALPQAGISSEWIYFALVCVDFADLAHSSVMPSLPLSKVKSIPVVIPPTNEQHRIVAKIEELFSELDKGIENLKTAQAQLKVYRQALLKHAFEGKLTAQWRAANPDKLESAAALLARIQTEREQRYRQQLQQWEAAGGNKPKAPKPLPPLTADELAELPELPEGWGWEKLGNVADLIGGVTKGKDLAGKEKISLPYLRVANVQDGYLDLTEIKNIEVELQDKNKYRLEYGDVLYTEGGDKDKLGRGAVWHSQIENCIHQNHIFRARIFGGVISPEILSLYSQTKSAKRYFFRHAKQTTNLASINLTVLSNLPVAIFSQVEQKQILQEIEAGLSEVDQLDQTLAASLQQSEALRQSILKKAFSGQLVAQDANDEPAAVLLERIKAERDNGDKPKRKVTA